MKERGFCPNNDCVTGKHCTFVKQAYRFAPSSLAETVRTPRLMSQQCPASGLSSFAIVEQIGVQSCINSARRFDGKVLFHGVFY